MTEQIFNSDLDSALYNGIPQVFSRTVYPKRDEVIFLDVRSPEETQAGIIEGAIMIPNTELDSVRLSSMQFDKPLVVYCRVGIRSQAVCEKIAAYNPDYELYNLCEGITEWVKENYAIALPSA